MTSDFVKEIEKKKEAKRRALLERTFAALLKLSRDIHFENAYIFGSIVKKKRFYYDSDIDIAVSGLKDEDFFLFMARASDLLGRDVDVVQLENHRLRDKILREGTPWKRPKQKLLKNS